MATGKQWRSRARQFALQALYQWQMTGEDTSTIQVQFMENKELANFDVKLFTKLLYSIPENLEQLDNTLSPFLDRTLSRVDPVERAVLRIGAYELLEHIEIPYRVIINEAVELAKRFGAEQGHRYVNGVLDRLARKIRVNEIATRRSRTKS
ncbi:hypothetical protein TI05_11730 [Achromatium sp. WMS3]|nr:hypothetical protein TI05_11730 [Achromatium sp. WMS3]